MSKRTIRIIIFLMSLAMIALITYQVYWIDSAIKVNNIQFRQNVHEALNNVVSRLEKNEVYDMASAQFGSSVFSNRYIVQDSNHLLKGQNIINRPYQTHITDSDRTAEWHSNIIVEDSIFFGGQQIKISYQFQNSMTPEYRDNMGHKVDVEENRFEFDNRSIDNFDQEVQKSIKKFAEKSRMVTVVLDELMSNQQSMKNRIDKNQLETLLRSELKDIGVNLSYEYAVVDKQKNEFLFANYSPEDEKNVLASDFSVKLFPNDISGKEHFLTVYFPKQTSFLIKKVWLNMMSSILLVLLIIFLFAFAIFAILRQKKVSEIKNDFINNMTHEFKTPISTVSLACEALQDNEIKKNKNFINNYVRIIQDENNRLRRQVDKVLQMATLDKKEFKLKFDKLDVHQVIDKAINHINLQVERKGGKIAKKLIADNHEIITDEVHLTNIIYNLLDNANKYSKINPEINIETEDHHQGILIRIKDNGIGMSEEVLNKIFEKFYRVPTGNLHDVKGFGLGLAYVKTMLMALGGQIKVKSTTGIGTIFEIILPIGKNGQN